MRDEGLCLNYGQGGKWYERYLSLIPLIIHEMKINEKFEARINVIYLVGIVSIHVIQELCIVKSKINNSPKTNT